MNDDVLQEITLLRRVAEGDEAAFREIFDLYKKRFYVAALKMMRSDDAAEEIVQEVFIKLWARRRALSAVGNPSGYLFAILYNSIYTHSKKVAAEKRMKRMLLEVQAERVFSMEEQYHEKETNQMILGLIGQLPFRQQQVYVLSKQEGLSREEIAERLHISPHTVKNHLQEAVKFIRAHIYPLYRILILFICLCS